MEYAEFVEAVRRLGAWRGERLWTLPTATLRSIEKTTAALALHTPPRRVRPPSAGREAWEQVCVCREEPTTIPSVRGLPACTCVFLNSDTRNP